MDKMVKLVYVESKYIQYLYKFDNKVMYNKGQRRPYLGILFTVRGHKYYAPLTHPKEKFLSMKNTEDFMKIAGGQYGAINFNNMIPVVDSAIIPILVRNILDKKYKVLLINQIEFFNEHDTEIINKATKLYKNYKNKKLRKEVARRCCNFAVLEEKSKQYNPNFKMKSPQTN